MNSEFVSVLAILQNGDLAGALSFNHTIQIWNSTDGSLKQTLKSHTYFIVCLAVLHNGNLVSGSYDKTVKIWSKSGLERTLARHTDRVRCLAVLANTDFASGSSDKTIIIWSSSGEYIRTLSGQDASVVSLAVLPSGELASGSSNETIIIWDRDGSLKKSVSAHSNSVTSLVVLDNGLLASGSFDKHVKIWDETGRLIYSHSYESHVESIGVFDNGDWLVGLRNGKILIKDKGQLESNESKVVLTRYYVGCLAIFSNGDFATGSYDIFGDFRGKISILENQD